MSQAAGGAHAAPGWKATAGAVDFHPLPPPGTERAKAAAVRPGPCGNGTGAAGVKRKRRFAAQPASPTRAAFSYQPRAVLRATL